MTFQIYYTTRSGRYSCGITRVEANSAEEAMRTEEAKQVIALSMFPEQIQARAFDKWDQDRIEASEGL